MVLLLAISSIFNAGVMIAPVVDRLSDFEAAHPFFASGVGSLAVAASIFLVLLAASWTFAKALQIFSTEKSVRTVFCRFALALLPLGLAMWAAHLLFHMATATSSFMPTLTHAWHALTGGAHPHAMSAMAGMQGMSQMGNMPGMNMDMSGMGAMTMVSKPIQLMLIPGAEGLNLFHLQIWMLDLGLLFTLYAGWRLVRQMASSARNAVAMLTLWALSSGLFYAICIWIYTQPMEMRGMGM